MRKPRVPRHEVLQPADPSYRLIALTKGKAAIVDTEDYDWLIQWNWTALLVGKRTYAYRNDRGRCVYMHRQILDCSPSELADHRDGNGLNNSKSNLRKCTEAQNVMNASRRCDNTSGYKGVGWSKQRSRWRSYIQVKGRFIHLGFYDDPHTAAHAYNAGALKYYGEFAKFNVINDRSSE